MTKLYLARGDADRALGINRALIDTLPTDALVQVVAIAGPDTVEVVPVPEPARTSHA